jgi:mitochondrial fission protein ELM1
MIQKIELLSKSFLNLIIANNDFDALLQKASIKFISQDSMNMIYESLSTSGKTFLFNMKIKNDNKVTRQIERLQKNKQIGYIENIAISEDIRKIKILPQNDYTDVFAEVEKVSFQLINKLNSTLK